MDSSAPAPDYEALFGFAERPFSLTPDPKYYFRSRSHSRAFDALAAGVTRRENLILVVGDLGVGKTTLCRTFVHLLERKTRAALVGNALLSADDLLRLMLQDLGAVGKDDLRRLRLPEASRSELQSMFDEFLRDLRSRKDGAVLIIDEAHSLPASTLEQIASLAEVGSDEDTVLQILLVSQPAIGGRPILPRRLDDRLITRTRLLPLERDECERYVTHRMSIAGGNAVSFSPRAFEVVHALSGGVPRLVNLLCERALQEGAVANARRVEHTMIESAAAALELLRIRPKRFRWFGTSR